MNLKDKQSCLFLLGLGLILLYLIGESEERITGKTTSTCDGPCGQLLLSCPVGERLAVRDAAHSVQKRTPLCKAFKGCSQPTQDVCCEQTPQDCVLAYTPSHLKELHRNCSGRTECVLQTERSDVEAAQCSSRIGQLLSSQTILNYVCISDNVVAEICSPTETVIEGRTLFAIWESKGSNRTSIGSACTCIAESIKWPTTNTIAVFLIDLRLNVPNSSECSNVSFSVRSGSKEKDLNCQTVADPRLTLPFVAVLNNSNVATLRLEINSYVPEFMWLGFEANENEDIRLTCKLQGLLPARVPSHESTLQDLDTIFDYDSHDSENSHKDTTPIPAIVGGVVAAVVVVVVVVAVIVAIAIRKRKRTQTPRPEADLDVTYYSTTDETLGNLQSSPQTLDSWKESKSVQEMYVSAEEVIANKRKSNPDHANVANSSGFSSAEHDTEYASALEVLKRKHQSQRVKSGTNADKINSNRRSSVENNYDRLNGQGCNPRDAILESYDQLEPETIVWDSYSFASGVKVKRSKKKGSVENSSPGARMGDVNEAYDDNVEPNRMRTLPVEAFEDYFELERPSSRGHSNASYIGIDELPPLKYRESTSGSSSTSLASARKSSTPSQVDFSRLSISSLNTGGDELYNDAESEPASRKKGKDGVFRASESAVPNPGLNTDLKDKTASRGAGSAAEHRLPVAAPRRKSRTSLSPTFD